MKSFWTTVCALTWVIFVGCGSEESVSTEVDAPLFIATMTHMEGSFKDDTNEKIFLRHVDQMRWAMDLFDEYGAKLTFESERSFAQANINWDFNMMKEVVDRGHGVGSHADFGAKDNLTEKEYVEEFTELKTLIDGLVGEENNQGVSGGTGPFDWVGTAAEAGFKYRNGVTGFACLSMSPSARSMGCGGWTDAAIEKTYYHDSVPVEFSERIRFLGLADADDLVPDENPKIVISGGELGELASLDEGRSNCFPDCVLTNEDIDVVFAQIDEALEVRDPSEPAKISMHIPLILLVEQNEVLLRRLLEGIQSYVDEGDAVWVTQLGAYQGYEDWKADPETVYYPGKDFVDVEIPVESALSDWVDPLVFF